jgi:hypothetical protein
VALKFPEASEVVFGTFGGQLFPVLVGGVLLLVFFLRFGEL